MASNPVVNMFKVRELRSRLLFTLLVLAVFRLGSVLTVPGIDANVLLTYFDELARQNKNSFASYMDFFVGGAFSNFSIFMLGVMPFISMQIIMQLAVIIFPSLKRISQEDGGQRKMQTITKVGTIVVCLIQSYAVTVYAYSIPGCIVLDNRLAFRLLTMLTVRASALMKRPVSLWTSPRALLSKSNTRLKTCSKSRAPCLLVSRSSSCLRTARLCRPTTSR